jgi:hypothetical protein
MAATFLRESLRSERPNYLLPQVGGDGGRGRGPFAISRLRSTKKLGGPLTNFSK